MAEGGCLKSKSPDPKFGKKQGKAYLTCTKCKNEIIVEFYGGFLCPYCFKLPRNDGTQLIFTNVDMDLTSKVPRDVLTLYTRLGKYGKISRVVWDKQVQTCQVDLLLSESVDKVFADKEEFLSRFNPGMEMSRGQPNVQNLFYRLVKLTKVEMANWIEKKSVDDGILAVTPTKIDALVWSAAENCFIMHYPNLIAKLSFSNIQAVYLVDEHKLIVESTEWEMYRHLEISREGLITNTLRKTTDDFHMGQNHALEVIYDYIFTQFSRNFKRGPRINFGYHSLFVYHLANKDILKDLGKFLKITTVPESSLGIRLCHDYPYKRHSREVMNYISQLSHNNFAMLFLWEACISQGCFAREAFGKSEFEALSRKTPHEKKMLLMHLLSNGIEIKGNITETIEEFRFDSERYNSLRPPLNTDNLATEYSVLLTPKKIVYKFPRIVRSSRVLRKRGVQIVKVLFDMRKHYYHGDFKELVQHYLIHGVFIAGKKFYLLGPCKTLHDSHLAYWFSNNLSTKSLLEKVMGDFSDISDVRAKVRAQNSCFAPSIRSPTKVGIENWVVNNKRVGFFDPLTTGIKADVAKLHFKGYVFTALKTTSPLPKRVYFTVPRIDRQFEGGEYEHLDIVETVTSLECSSTACFLNRNLVLILEYFDIRDILSLRLMERYIEVSEDSLSNRKIIVNQLNSIDEGYYPRDFSEGYMWKMRPRGRFYRAVLKQRDDMLKNLRLMSEGNVDAIQSVMQGMYRGRLICDMLLEMSDITTDGFVGRCLETISNYLQNNLVNHCNVYVPNAGVFVAVHDPTRILQEGEMFLKVRRPDGAEVITGNVYVGKMDCFDGRDTARLVGVECKLKFTNVLVVHRGFKGLERGKKYFVIWDETLVPLGNTVVKNPGTRKFGPGSTGLSVSDQHQCNFANVLQRENWEKMFFDERRKSTFGFFELDDQDSDVDGDGEFGQQGQMEGNGRHRGVSLMQALENSRIHIKSSKSKPREQPADASLFSLEEELPKTYMDEAREFYEFYAHDIISLMKQFDIDDECVLFCEAHPMASEFRPAVEKLLSDYSEAFRKIDPRFQLRSATAWWKVAVGENVKFQGFPFLIYRWLALVHQRKVDMQSMSERI